MLVLSRKVQQNIVITVPKDAPVDKNGEIKIEVIVVRILSDKVRLGILADRGISIHREEVQQPVDKENKDLNRIIEEVK